MNPVDKIGVVVKSLLIHITLAFLIISILMFIFSRIVPGLFFLAAKPLQNPVEFTIGVLVVGVVLLIPVVFIAGIVFTARYTSSHIKDSSSIQSLYAILSALLYIIILFFLIKLIIPYMQSPWKWSNL